MNTVYRPIQKDVVLSAAGDAPSLERRKELNRLSLVLGTTIVLTLGLAPGEKPTDSVLKLGWEFLFAYLWVLAIVQAVIIARVARVVLDLAILRARHSGRSDVDVSLSEDGIAKVETEQFEEMLDETTLVRICRSADLAISMLLIVALIVCGLTSVTILITHMPVDVSLSVSAVVTVRTVIGAFVFVAVTRFARFVLIEMRRFRDHLKPSDEELRIEKAIREFTEGTERNRRRKPGSRSYVPPLETLQNIPVMEERLKQLRRKRRLFL